MARWIALGAVGAYLLLMIMYALRAAAHSRRDKRRLRTLDPAHRRIADLIVTGDEAQRRGAWVTDPTDPINVAARENPHLIPTAAQRRTQQRSAVGQLAWVFLLTALTLFGAIMERALIGWWYSPAYLFIIGSALYLMLPTRRGSTLK